jgi:hypothetical protein
VARTFAGEIMEYLKMFITQDRRLLYLDQRFVPDMNPKQYLPLWLTYLPLSTFPFKDGMLSGVYQ